MKQVTPQEFLNKTEDGLITDIFVIGRRVYGKDSSVDYIGPGKIYAVVWADVP